MPDFEVVSIWHNYTAFARAKAVNTWSDPSGFFIFGFVPRHVVTIGITRAAVERTTVLAPAPDELAAVFRTAFGASDTDFFEHRFDVTAGRETGAAYELTVTTQSLHERLSAFGTYFAGRLGL